METSQAIKASWKPLDGERALSVTSDQGREIDGKGRTVRELLIGPQALGRPSRGDLERKPTRSDLRQSVARYAGPVALCPVLFDLVQSDVRRPDLDRRGLR